jgi:hypothetical protein
LNLSGRKRYLLYQFRNCSRTPRTAADDPSKAMALTKIADHVDNKIF